MDNVLPCDSTAVSARLVGLPNRVRLSRFAPMSTVGFCPNRFVPAPGSSSPNRYHATVFTAACEVAAQPTTSASVAIPNVQLQHAVIDRDALSAVFILYSPFGHKIILAER